MTSWIRTLLLAAALAACSPASRQVRDLQSAGQTEEAAHTALRALREAPDDARLIRLAESSLDAIVEARMVTAAEQAEAGEWLEAISTLDGLSTLLERGALRGVTVRQSEVAAMRLELTAEAVAALQQRSDEAVEAGSWAGAVARLEQCERLEPGRSDVRDRLIAARRGWAEAELAAGEPRAAASRLARSAAESPRDAASAAEIFAALGRSELSRGACRAAAADLTAAAALVPDTEPEALARAVRCARTGVQLSGAIPARLSADLTAILETRGTTHLRLGGASTRTVPGPEGAPIQTGPYRITLQPDGAPRIRPQVPRLSTRRIPLSADCRDPYGAQWPGSCHAGSVVIYEEVEEYIDGELSGVLTIEDLSVSPPRLITHQPVRVTSQEVARWRGDVLVVSGTTAAWPDSGPSATRAAPARRIAREQLLAGLTAALAERAAQEVLATVDLEPAVADVL